MRLDTYVNTICFSCLSFDYFVHITRGEAAGCLPWLRTNRTANYENIKDSRCRRSATQRIHKNTEERACGQRFTVWQNVGDGGCYTTAVVFLRLAV